MTKKTKNTKSHNGGKKNKSRKIKMAYSLNNWQPVQCTLVSDQPFFYMEEAHDYDDEILNEDFLEGFESLSDDLIISEIQTMKNKMEAYDRMSHGHNHKVENRLKEFLNDSLQFTSKNNFSEQTNISEICSVLSKSRMGQELIKFAEKSGIKIEFSGQVENALYDKKAEKIFIRSDLNILDQVLLLAQELRRFWQDAHGAMVEPLSLHPDQSIIINRAQKADLCVAIVRCAWEMKLQGVEKIWSRIERSSLSDLGRALAREALSDFRTLNNGKASSAVFETWFLSERCRQEDKDLIQSMLADYRGYIYENSNQSQQSCINIISKLGEQPFGNNYLAAYAQMIMGDALFTEVRDRSNANFLWFIKFERSFKETEQELQSSQSTKIAGIDQRKNKNKIEDNQNEVGAPNSVSSGRNNTIFGDEKIPLRNNIIHVQFGFTGNSVQEYQT